MAIIKRYPNRKLYDTEAKRYVTLDQITNMIQQGQEIHVVDHESGEDVTTLTLTQIILEQEKKQSGFLPRTLLTDLIRLGGGALEQVRRSVAQSSVVQKLGNSVDLSEHGHALETQIDTLFEQSKLSVESAHIALKVDERLADLLHILNLPSYRDIQQLQEQIEALNHRLTEVIEERSSPNDPPQVRNERKSSGQPNAI